MFGIKMFAIKDDGIKYVWHQQDILEKYHAFTIQSLKGKNTLKLNYFYLMTVLRSNLVRTNTRF